MQEQVFDYFDYLWESRRGFNELEVLQELPAPLRSSLSLHINREMIARVPFLVNASAELIRDLVLHLEPLVFPPAAEIIRLGELGDDMFFIAKGQVDVLVPGHADPVATLGSGAFFGEIALLLSTPRTATVRAIDYCDLYRLDRPTFDRIVSRYSEFASYISRMAEERRPKPN
jgi:voltage-gated potassium channel